MRIRSIRKIQQVYILETVFYLLIILASFIDFRFQGSIFYYEYLHPNIYLLKTNTTVIPKFSEISYIIIGFCLYGIGRIIYGHKKINNAPSFEYLYYPLAVLILFVQNSIRSFSYSMLRSLGYLLTFNHSSSNITSKIIIQLQSKAVLILEYSILVSLLGLIIVYIGIFIHKLSKQKNAIKLKTYPEVIEEIAKFPTQQSKGSLVEFYLLLLVAAANIDFTLLYILIGFPELGKTFDQVKLFLDQLLLFLILLSFSYFFENEVTNKIHTKIMAKLKLKKPYTDKALKFILVYSQFFVAIILFGAIFYTPDQSIYTFLINLGNQVIQFSVLLVLAILATFIFKRINLRLFRMNGNKLTVIGCLTIMSLIFAIMGGSMLAAINTNQFQVEYQRYFNTTSVNGTNIEGYISGSQEYSGYVSFSNIVLIRKTPNSIVVDKCYNVTKVASNTSFISISNFESSIFYEAYQPTDRLWLKITVNESIIVLHNQSIQLARMLNGVCVPYSY